MVLQELRERSEIKKAYNGLLKELQTAGHKVESFSRKGSPFWRTARRPEQIDFEAKKQNLVAHFDQESERAERAAGLLQQIDRHYGNKKLRRPVIEHVRANLLNVLSGLTTPKLLHDLDLYYSEAAQQGIRLTLDNLEPSFRKEIEQSGVKRKALLDRLAIYKYEEPNPLIGRGLLTPKGQRTILGL